MTDIDKHQDAFADLVAAKVKDSCHGKCNLSIDARGEMGHILGVIKDEGGGDYGQGAELLRSALKFFKRIDAAANVTVKIIYGIIVVAVAKLIFRATGIGFTDILKKIVQ